ncbi:MAG: tRNA uridine-5-carboxymethylaminomethyl(34) synthesis GTPase MnmE [Campylobacteraceae bacterium]|jgi:tRNA modification GTPase|nr:tRNA uridine-5-carboxymethylaminomethyl(34) synthesis GTPase MnmE [Campylobacteraceae bacterium]MBT4179291.1 tRNA uridine-5-carboxymethylaminomethyl(34) synthesis GTPase MnmE [Campylobacteraceae bacterium]MBT4572737.1 tRNA uridine-5-carboxymethylaminomethyl(34) synthesis GTPase MnmE [Campylobacteraceae bacterium]MBT5983027.1 tRNA uridine-5-carboxymethylaminomethyl(34) synthesis GTPase MnmE [Campylobacteraceae bacterium]MBT7116893.1 tRNA uridine-5-carboxymethylaminomethyl(34) synthesis GTPase
MILDDTIVAVATANGVGSISIVRLSGPNALEIALKISKKDNLNSRYATLSQIYNDENELIDEALLIYFKNPSSFTGEDIVEFQCHGGYVIANMVLETTIKYGARLANNGEFSKRAYLNGKIDLTQAQAISNMIEAQSEDAVKLLARQLKGELKEFIEDIREDLLFMLAYTEVNIDYAEEDLPSDIFEQINNKIIKIQEKLKRTLDSSKRREGLMQGFKVAIVGKPNVGKSSFLNALLDFDRAIVSDIAGTTRDTIEESVKIGSHIIKIIDTAGIREANDTIEQIGIARSKEAINEADIIIGIFDNSREFDNEDKQILSLLEESNQEKLIVLNKVDLTTKFDISKIDNYIELSCNNDISILIDSLEKILDKNNDSNEIMLVSSRQIKSVESTLNNIEQAIDPLNTGELEFFAHHINEALEEVSNITRAYEHDQMLDVMFGSFCLGK